MKLTKLIMCAAVAGALAFGAATSAWATFTTNYPIVKINISGTLNYSPNLNGQLSQEAPLKKISYSTKTLIDLLNASPTASNSVFYATGATTIPAGSYFLWDVIDEELYLTNKNGFLFPLLKVYDGTNAWNYGYMEIKDEGLIGTYSISASNSSGSETDKTGFHFFFNDGASNENEIELFGSGTLTWSYGKKNGLFQKSSVSVALSGFSNDGSFIAGYGAVSATFSASGSGSNANQFIPGSVPFFYEY